MNISPPILILRALALILGHIPFDQVQGFLDRLFAVFRRLVNGDLPVMDIPDQLAHGLVGDASQHVEDRELDRGQRDADGHAVVSEIEAVDEDLFQEQVQVARILADEERLELQEEDRIKGVEPAMADGNAFRTVARTHPAQKTVLIPKQFEALDDHRGGEQLPLQHRLAQDFIQLGVARVLSSRARARTVGAKTRNGPAATLPRRPVSRKPRRLVLMGISPTDIVDWVQAAPTACS